jgi:hypothetical protein
MNPHLPPPSSAPDIYTSVWRPCNRINEIHTRLPYACVYLKHFFHTFHRPRVILSMFINAGRSDPEQYVASPYFRQAVAHNLKRDYDYKLIFTDPDSAVQTHSTIVLQQWDL